jgi:DNA-binding response OmpR family regulator
VCANHDLKMILSGNDYAQPTIFVIERNRELRSDLTAILELEGYAVAGVDTVDEGLALLKTFKVSPRLVICAIDRDGLGAAQFLGAARDAAAECTSFLFMTTQPGNDLPLDEQRLIFYLPKPFSVPDLLEIVQLALD